MGSYLVRDRNARGQPVLARGRLGVPVNATAAQKTAAGELREALRQQGYSNAEAREAMQAYAQQEGGGGRLRRNVQPPQRFGY